LLTPSTPADQQALADAAQGDGGPLDVGGTQVVPGAAGLLAGDIRNGLPVTLIVTLVLLALAALAGAAPCVRRRAGAMRGLRPAGLATLGRRVLARRR